MSMDYRKLSDISKEYFENWKETHEKELKKLLHPDRELAEGIINNDWRIINRTACAENVTDIVEWTNGHLRDVVKVLVPDTLRDDFYYMIRKMNRFQYSKGYYRRSVRTALYDDQIGNVIRYIRACFIFDFWGGNMEDFLRDRMSEEKISMKYNSESVWYNVISTQDMDALIMARIDAGDEGVISAIRDAILSENNTVTVTRNVIRAILMSDNDELHELLGKFLLAARLSEGIRQVICENADCGTVKGFLKILSVIKDNGLIRYAAVGRAVATWTGLYGEKDFARISEKVLGDIYLAINDRKAAEEFLRTDDAIKINIGLWAIGFYEIRDVYPVLEKIILNGDHQQKIAASFYLNSLQITDLEHNIARMVIENASDDIDVVMAYIQYYMQGFSLKNEKMNYSYYFDSKEQALKHYEILKGICENLPQKRKVVDSFIFPWYYAKISRGMILGRMAFIAKCLDDTEMKEYICERLDEIDDESEDRSGVIRVCLKSPKTELQRKVLVKCLANRSSYARDTALNLINDISLTEDEYQEIEKMLKYKTADLRSNVILILKKRDPHGLHNTVSRLLKSGDKMVRLGGLDILREKQDEIENVEDLLELVDSIEDPENDEKILIDELLKKDGSLSAGDNPLEMKGYGLYDPDKAGVEITDKYPYGLLKPEPFRKYFNVSQKRVREIIDSITTFIDKNSELEYTGLDGEEHRLGDISDGEGLRAITRNVGVKICDFYPFKEQWKKIMEENHIADNELKFIELLFAKYIASDGVVPEKVEKSDYGRCCKYLDFIFGQDKFEYSQFDYKYGFYNYRDIISIMRSIRDVTMPVEIVRSILQYLVQKIPKGDLWLRPAKDDSYRKFDKIPVTQESRIERIIRDAIKIKRGDGFKELSPWLIALEFRMDYAAHRPQNRRIYWYSNDGNIDIYYYLAALYHGVVKEDVIYRVVLEELSEQDALENLSFFGVSKRRAYEERMLKGYIGVSADQEIPEDHDFVKLGKKIYKRLTDMILSVELRRGDSETPLSHFASDIKVVRGIGWLMQILNALGDSTLDRTQSYYGGGVSKKFVLSHLLRVSEPLPDETVMEFSAAIKKNKIKENRLYEVAMYAPAWQNLIEEHLKLKGFKSGCYYFMAHMDEYFDEQKMAIIARYTPLTKEELREGCFDINWFRDVYGELGEKTFDKIYKAAKYISDGGKHQRARKYADAALGRVTVVEIEEKVDDKRNKDLLMSLGLVPLEGKKDMLQRYEYLQKFQKESKKFGAQRRASEAQAVSTAMKNLATNAGYADEIRLILAMETELVKENSRFFEGMDIGDFFVKIEVAEGGKASLVIEKAGKKLKTQPAAIKKNEEFLEIKDFKDKLVKQYRRTVQMFEKSMEDREIYAFDELKALEANPVLGEIVRNLVLIDTESGDLFLLEDRENITEECSVRIAHPFDMYKAGKWAKIQERFYERFNESGVKQPFRQVFRELYLKLDEEAEKTDSRMFAGNQVQPKKAVACLQSRRWIVDYENGLEKVDFKDNIITEIYAEADWFSPADVEEPVIEYVSFNDRKTWKPIKIKDVPDILYSETMRDVDLAVSVAHPGGVDPETSHSTIEMRKVVLEFNLKLFGLSNVTFDGTHALIEGKKGKYRIHLGSGVIHKVGCHQINIVAVQGSRRSKIFLPYIDEDPKTAEIMTKVLMFAEDNKIKDPEIIRQMY